jgi:hypothetical protein
MFAEPLTVTDDPPDVEYAALICTFCASGRLYAAEKYAVAFWVNWLAVIDAAVFDMANAVASRAACMPVRAALALL